MDSACLAGPDGSCVPQIVTDWRVFLGWEDYDLIHVSTHGVQRCSEIGPYACTTLLFTGRKVTLPHPAIDPPGYLDALVRALESMTHVGVELRGSASYLACPGGTPSDSLPAHIPPIARGTVAFEQLCTGGLRYEVVTEDFFRNEYPDGLDDKIIFLNACETFAHPGLVRHLARTGNTTVLGWHATVSNSVAGEVARVFYESLLGPDQITAVTRDASTRRGGLRVDSAWHRAVESSQGQGLRSVPVFRSDGSTRRAANRAATSRNDRKRAREIVFLVDDDTDLEVQDHATLRLVGAPADGLRDSVDVVVDVSGFVAGDPIDAYRVRFRIDGQELPVATELPQSVAEDVRRFRGTIPLGFDVSPGQRVNLDVRVEIPGGGISRWLYEDLLLLSRCSFVGRVTEIRINNPRERLLATLGAYQGRAIVERNGNLRLTVEHTGNPRTDHGAPAEVTDFSVQMQFPAALDPDETGRRPVGHVQLPAGVLQVRRPNPHHNPAKPQNSQDPMWAVFDSPIMRPAMFASMEISAFTATRMAGSLRAPFESPQSRVLFEGVFDAGTARSCGVMR